MGGGDVLTYNFCAILGALVHLLPLRFVLILCHATGLVGGGDALAYRFCAILGGLVDHVSLCVVLIL